MSRPVAAAARADQQPAIAIFHRFGAKVVLFTMPYVDPSDRQSDGVYRPSPDRVALRRCDGIHISDAGGHLA